MANEEDEDFISFDMIMLFILGFAIIILIGFFIKKYKNSGYDFDTLKNIVRNPDKVVTEKKDELLSKNNIDIPDDPLVQLDQDSHLNAMKQFCYSKGYDYDIKNNTCLHTNSSCESSSNINFDINSRDKNQAEYLEWINGKCLKSVPLVKRNVCDEYGFPYKRANVVCEDNLCKVVERETCILTKDYCKSKGTDYRSGDDNNGDCYTNDAQKFTQVILGETITKKFKVNAERMVEKCKENPLSVDCGKGIALLPLTPLEITKDASIRYAVDTYKEVRDACKGNSTKEVGKCIQTITDRIPWIWAGTKAAEILDNLLSLIPGYPRDAMIISRMVNIILKGTVFPALLLEVGLLYGPDAIEAIDKYGKVAADAISKYGAKYGKEGVRYIKDYGEKAWNNMDKYGEKGFLYVKSCATSGSCLIDGGNVIKDMGEKIWDCANNPVSCGKNIGDDIKNFGNDVGRFFRNIF